MILFKKKNKNNENKLELDKGIIENKKAEVKSKELEKGVRSLKDILAPAGIDRSDKSCLKVGNKYVRSFILNGYPSNVAVGWLDNLINYDGDMDMVIYIEPADERNALEELTAKITQFEAQLDIEVRRGSNRNVTRLRNMIEQLYAEREKLEQNYESLFHVQIACNLYANSKEELEKQTQLLDNRMKGRKINLMPLYLRQDDGYKTVLPFGKTYLPDMFRNFNSGALTACFPFYNSEISHKNGVFLGVNLSTATPVYIDFFDRTILNNGNVTVFGASGSGKTFFLSLLVMRSALRGIRTVIIDPEGEYKVLTKSLGGANIYIAPDSDTKINPFDIEEEEILDDFNRPTGQKVVKIKEKVADLLNLIAVMAGGITQEQKSLLSYVISKLYEERGFTEDPESLYVKESYFDEKTGIFYNDGMKKPMPTFSDFYDKLVEVAEKENSTELDKLVKSLKMFKKGEVYDMFDCQTSEDIKNFKNAPVVTFDVSQLEESILRPIGMYIALSWTWEKFIKKNPKYKKFVLCDEAWMLVNKNMAGHEYTSQFLETASRRIRKRNGGLIVASQNFIEFENNPQGKAVLTNASVNIFLKQESTDIDAVQNTFKLSDGERNFLLSAKKGELLIKMGTESSIAYALAFQYEKELIERKKQVKK